MTDNTISKKVLGRGLSALMAEVGIDPNPPTEAAMIARMQGNLVPIEKLNPNPNQPRRNFDEDELDELAQSIRGIGLIQPIVVRPDPNKTGQYQIVAGERRWRAAQLAKLHQVPVVVRELGEFEVMQIAIVENIQRSDLNPMEEAQGYHQLLTKFTVTQEQLSTSLGKSRSHIANMVRLLTLPDSVQQLVRNGKLSAGHARALIGSTFAESYANEVVTNGLTVRQTEALVRTGLTAKPQKTAESKDADTKALEADLSAALSLQVQIQQRGNGGQVIITYADYDQLDGLIALLNSAR
jgi:ParB family transcriptional regulator, chromosome partitioning protein